MEKYIKMFLSTDINIINGDIYRFIYMDTPIYLLSTYYHKSSQSHYFYTNSIINIPPSGYMAIGDKKVWFTECDPSQGPLMVGIMMLRDNQERTSKVFESKMRDINLSNIIEDGE